MPEIFHLTRSQSKAALNAFVAFNATVVLYTCKHTSMLPGLFVENYDQTKNLYVLCMIKLLSCTLKIAAGDQKVLKSRIGTEKKYQMTKPNYMT